MFSSRGSKKSAAHHNAIRPHLAGVLILLISLLLGGCGERNQIAEASRSETPIPVVGFFTLTRRESVDPATGRPEQSLVRATLGAFQEALAEAGLKDGKDFRLETRFVFQGEEDSTAELAAELVTLQPAVIVVTGFTRVRAMKDATDSIPIVMIGAGDPVENGLVPHIGQPENNLTGLVQQNVGLAAKRLQYLREAVPDLSRVAVLSLPGWDVPGNPRWRQWQDVSDATTAMGLELFVIEVRGQGGASPSLATLESAMTEAAERHAQALYPLPDGLFDVARKEIAALALQIGLPTVYYRGDFADEGGFMTYGEGVSTPYRLAATDYVARILRGAQLKDLPIRFGDELDLVINLKTARALGVVVPPSLVAEARRIID